MKRPTLTRALAALLTLPFVFALPQQRATTCNGSPSLCSKSYGNVTFVGAHDSFAVSSTSSAGNQDYDVTQQLTDGIRMLQNQAHNSNNTIELCHTSCSLLDGGSLQDYLAKVKSWADANPTEVITLLLVNSDNIAVAEFGQAYEAVGLDGISYSPTAAATALSQWPTLGEMVDSGKRVVTFMDTGADFTTVPYIIDEFSNMWETAYDVTTSFDCAVNRTHGDASTQLMTINHFLDTASSIGSVSLSTPNKSALPTTNAASGSGSLGDQAGQCVAQWGRAPNFMLVDFYEVGGGSVFEVAAGLNGVAYDPATPIASAPASATQSGASGNAQETSVPLSAGVTLRSGSGWSVPGALVLVTLGLAVGGGIIL